MKDDFFFFFFLPGDALYIMYSVSQIACFGNKMCAQGCAWYLLTRSVV